MASTSPDLALWQTLPLIKLSIAKWCSYSFIAHAISKTNTQNKTNILCNPTKFTVNLALLIEIIGQDTPSCFRIGSRKLQEIFYLYCGYSVKEKSSASHYSKIFPNGTLFEPLGQMSSHFSVEYSDSLVVSLCYWLQFIYLKLLSIVLKAQIFTDNGIKNSDIIIVVCSDLCVCIHMRVLPKA